MITIYVPRLIESAEQAEALAPQTIVIEYADDDVMWCAALAEGFRPRDLLPETGRRLVALVPIEAEEEREEARSVSILHGGTYTRPARTRYVTPWEEAQ